MLRPVADVQNILLYLSASPLGLPRTPSAEMLEPTRTNVDPIGRTLTVRHPGHSATPRLTV